jgi:hypothetical protein
MRRKRNRKLCLGFGLCAPSVAFHFEGETDQQGGGGGEGNPRSSMEQSIVDRLGGTLQNIDQRFAQNQQMMQLLQDPMIQQVLSARQSGKKFKLVDDAPAAPQVEEPLVPLDQMNNTQMYQHMNKTLTNQLGQMLPQVVEQMIEKHLGPIQQQLQGVNGFVAQTVEQKTQNKIQEAQKKYTDFNKFGNQMVELYKQAPGLEPEELYLIAKARAGSPVTPVTQMESERPGTSATRPTLFEARGKKPLPPGPRGFEALMKQTLDRQDFSMFPEG